MPKIGSLYVQFQKASTYRRIGHAPSHRVPHLIGHSVGRWISSAKTIRPRNGWSERFRVHHHFVMRVHHSVHAEWQCCLSWSTLLRDQDLINPWRSLSCFFSSTTLITNVCAIRLTFKARMALFLTRHLRAMSWSWSSSCRRHNFTSWTKVRGEPMDFRPG